MHTLGESRVAARLSTIASKLGHGCVDHAQVRGLCRLFGVVDSESTSHRGEGAVGAATVHHDHGELGLCGRFIARSQSRCEPPTSIELASNSEIHRTELGPTDDLKCKSA